MIDYALMYLEHHLSGTYLLVGPIIGTVTKSSVRILVETDHPTTISLNVFLVDELETDGRFVKSEV